MDKLISTAVGVVVAVGASGLLFIGANKLFDLAPKNWPVFNTVAGAATGFLTFLVLWGNNVAILVEGPIVGDDPTGFLAFVDIILLVVVNTIVPTAIGAVAGYLLAIAQDEDKARQFALSAIAGGLLGLWLGLTLEPAARPSFDVVAVVVWVAVGLAVGLAVWTLRGRHVDVRRPLVFWGTVGWLFGTFVVSTLDGSYVEGLIAAFIVGAGIGVGLGLRGTPQRDERIQIDQKSRTYIFLVPALGFIAATLVFPLLRTVWLSLLNSRGEEFVGGRNYGDIFTDNTIFNIDNWTNIFTSQMYLWAVILIGAGFIAGLVAGRQRQGIANPWGGTSGSALLLAAGLLGVAVIGNAFIDVFRDNGWWSVGLTVALGVLLAVAWSGTKSEGGAIEASGALVTPTSLGIFLLAFAAFASLRGTIFNNLWWVFTVTILATSLGLAIAVLADRAKWGENVAKSLIFMPMAISFIGAGIIWRFMFIARPETKNQTGVLNSIWVALGQISNSGPAKSIVAILVIAAVAGLLWVAYRGYKAEAGGVLAGSIVLVLPLLWFLWRLLGPGIGGFAVTEAGEVIADTVIFANESPFNNFWLMVVLIWIQTGFTMVIFSAAIKSVPTELLEAARVDGATESQTFWRVTIPQIAPTVGVVVTTLIVLVMKVFDIVKVMTNGNFDTQVIANEMWERAFTQFNQGLGSALAIVLFIAVLPVMYLNIRRMQKAAV